MNSPGLPFYFTQLENSAEFVSGSFYRIATHSASLIIHSLLVAASGNHLIKRSTPIECAAHSTLRVREFYVVIENACELTDGKIFIYHCCSTE